MTTIDSLAIRAGRTSTAQPTDGIVGWIVTVMEELGGPGAGLAVGLENLFPPLPSEIILPLAGLTASRGSMTLVGAILWTTLGSIVGAVVLYAVGALLGRRRTRAIAFRVPLVRVSDVDRAEAWFAKYGVATVFFGRMIPMFRSFISIPAGIERMSVGTFLVFTALGSLVWNTTFVLAGYLLGENWHVIEKYAGFFSKAVVLVVVLAVVTFVVVRLTSNRGRRRGGHQASR